MSTESPAAASMAEKGEGPPAYEQRTVAPGEPTPLPSHEREANWFTRNGLNLASFQRRDYGTGLVELDRTMKKRHLNMIAIGGSIGAGFFVGSGSALANGGPGWLLVDFLLIGIMIFNVVYALGELAVMFPVSGSFYTYSSRFIDPSWGFAMGWNYVFQWAVVLPLELTVCGLTIEYWNKDVSVTVWITIFLVAIIAVNVFGTLGYAEEEFWSSCLKLGAVVVFMVIALVLVCGGGPAGSDYDHYIGAANWQGGKAFKNGFYGFCSIFVTAAFAFSGTELVGLGAAESQNPAKSLPGAIKQVFWRITLFYVLGLLMVGLLVDSDDSALLNVKAKFANGDTNTSPFVLVGRNSHLWGFDHFMNVIILVSVLSIGVSGVYGGSRTLTAMAQQGYAPRFFTYIDRSGRPLFSVIAILVFGLLAYVNVTAAGPEVFYWLQALSGLAALFTWGSICLAHIRFRAAWSAHGHTLDEIPFTALGGVWGSWLGVVLVAVVLVTQLYVAVADAVATASAKPFFQQYMAILIVGVFWVAGFLWKREGWRRIDQIDVDTGRRQHDWREIRAFREKTASWPAWKRILNHLI